jgi:hypothetical protein
MPFLTADLEARPTLLLMMASGGDRDKHPWGGTPSHDGRQLPSHRERVDAAPDQASSLTR